MMYIEEDVRIAFKDGELSGKAKYKQKVKEAIDKMQNNPNNIMSILNKDLISKKELLIELGLDK